MKVRSKGGKGKNLFREKEECEKFAEEMKCIQ
jgi:hypothetical protein